MQAFFKTALSLILLYASFGWAINTPLINKYDSNKNDTVFRAYYSNKQQIEAINKVVTPWEVNTKQKYAVIQIENEKQFDLILSLGFKLRSDIKLQNKINRDKYNFTKADNNIKGNSGITGYSCYSTVEETFARIDSMAVNYPSLTEVIDIGDSWEKTVNNANGYDLKVLKITNKSINEVKPILFISSAIHAREYTTAELNTRFAEYLLGQYGIDSDVTWMLDHQEIHLLLQTNPDGRKQAETGLLWRKNTNQAYCSPTSDSRGTDLNRNYPFQWQNNVTQCDETYSGPSMNSEPEVDSLVTYMRSIYADNRGSLPSDAAPEDTSGIFIDIHSYSQLILWPWGYTANDSANANQFAAFGKRVAYFNDYTPEPASSLYTVTGASIDTSYGELGVASLVYELGTSFFQDCPTFESKIYPDNLQSLLYVSRVTRSPYISPLGPDIENLLVIPNIVLNGQSLAVTGVANDDRYNHSNGTQSVDQVQSVQAYINDLPWLSINGSQLLASDGTFDNAIEGFNSSIAGGQLQMGQNTVYVRATDTSNKPGAVYSQFVNVVTANDVGTLSGTITNAVTHVGIDSAMLKINQSLALSNSLGQYNQYVFPTTSDLMVEADGFVPKLIPNITVSNQQTQIQDIQLEPYCDVYLDDIESGVGTWQAQSPWAITTAQSNSGTHAWTDSPAGNYQDNISTSLTSEIINVVGIETAEISFNHYCDTESGYDYGRLEVNIDNSNWQEVFSCSGDANWKHVNQRVNIANAASSLQFRFRLTSDAFVTRDGWYIDDVVFKVSGQVCHAASNSVVFMNGFE